jgi:hypothetical protein
VAIAKEVWAKARFLFELGKSLSDIHKETDIDSSSISKKAKKEGWIKAKNQELKSEIMDIEATNSTLLKKKSTAIEKLAKLSDFEITLFDETVTKELKHESLVFSTASLALIRNNQILTANKKTVMLKVQQFSAEGQRIGEDFEPYEVPLSPSDVKDCIEGTDKASVTLKVNDRFAPKIELNNTNAQQNNSTEIVGYKVKTIE